MNSSMSLPNLVEIRLMPPMAIARLGASDDPMDNYDVTVCDARRLGWRQVKPALTLHVNVASGEISGASVPTKLSFKDANGFIRPVSPFLEVWTRFQGQADLVPLLLQHLKERGLKPSDIRWSVHVANHKAFRRTAVPADKIECQLPGITDHQRYPLVGKCENFIKGATIPFGFVQYINPTDAFPEIRFRFTPAPGYVYAPEGSAPKSFHAEVYRKDGPWANWQDPGGPLSTNPGGIYYGGDAGKSRGYLDDACDGIIDVQLDAKGTKLSSYARVMAGPPAFAPDSLPIRRVIDELEMAMHGPRAGGGTNVEVQEIVRRAFESIRLMNTIVMNGNQVIGRGSNMTSQDSNDVNRYFAPIMAPSTVDNLAVQAIHEYVFGGLESGVPPWFAETFRRFNEIGDLTDTGRRRMPAMMRGADGRYLALTRRQLDIIRMASGLSSLEKSPPAPTAPPAP
jgi:hypothetical protein